MILFSRSHRKYYVFLLTFLFFNSFYYLYMAKVIHFRWHILEIQREVRFTHLKPARLEYTSDIDWCQSINQISRLIYWQYVLLTCDIVTIVNSIYGGVVWWNTTFCRTKKIILLPRLIFNLMRGKSVAVIQISKLYWRPVRM